MIYINEKKFKEFKSWKEDSIHILTDFDRTITRGDCDGSWGIFNESHLLPEDFVIESNALYKHYRPFEIDETIDTDTKLELMKKWWILSIELFTKYKLSEKVLMEIAKNSKDLILRDNAKEFLKEMHRKNIPVIIISAGIGNFIELTLINNECYYDNIHIISNFINFENGIANGIKGEVIHGLNKNEVSMSDTVKKLIKDRPNIILLGDNISDITMLPHDKKDKALKIGFLDYFEKENIKYFKKEFDIVCTNNTSFDELSKKLYN